MSAAERETRILQYWKAVELFSPQKLPRLHPNHQKEPVFRLEGDTPLPWDASHWFRSPETGYQWRFTAYCGLYRLSRVRSRLEHHFGRDPAHFDRRTDGESCLFALQITAEGRPLLDTFVLASCPWAVGRLRSPGPTHPAWLNGFEAAAQEEGLRLAERFAVREDDEIGRELNSQPGVHVGRPIQPGDLQTEIERIAQSLGITAALQPGNGLLKAHQISEKYQFEAEADDFLNSFFLRDLERIAHETSRCHASVALSRYLCPDEAVSASERCDVRTSLSTLWQNTAPGLVPSGHWPAPAAQSLYFSQQLAVNTLFDELARQSSPLFGVNGPPGTGKTTLLRDLIASVLVRRAQILATLPHPQSAFQGPTGRWNTAGRSQLIYLWREDLLGFEIVVASSNNRAVENVTLEIPAKRAVAADYLPEVDYFADFASRLLQEQRTGEEGTGEAWGLMAARLGNKKNRNKFVSSFWFADKKRPQPRTRAENGFLEYLKTVRTRPSNWKKAVAAFEAALKQEAAIRHGRIAAWKAVEKQKTLTTEWETVQHKLQSAEASISAVRRQAQTSEDRQKGCKDDLKEALEARRCHQDFKPGLVGALFSLGAAYREWREKDRLLAATVKACEIEVQRSRVECEAQRQDLQKAEAEIARLATALAAQQDLVTKQRQHLDRLRQELGPALPAIERWIEHPEERERSSPWADETWNQARTRVLLAALDLHRTFIECVPDKVKTNLNGAIDILKGKVSPEVDSQALRSAWATLFFVVPVVSTTFASFDRLFAHLGRESLGWLLIDEGGQATPQSAAGTLWRSKRAVIVGDPRQLEPIVSLPFTAQQALRAHFGVEETWLPSQNSAQTLADRVSRFGTWLQSDDSEERIWVGSPLRVHRRCEKPMFDISNQIAYGGQMVYATEELPLLLPRSSWLDVQATESEGHWIREEGVVLGILLADLIRAGVSPANILLISPFRDVARKLKEIASRHKVTQAGTIHVSQGKESEIVILVLGGDPHRPGAKDWASEKPNLLNVAASRAKRRLFIIGNREEWSQYPNFSDAVALLESEERIQPRSIRWQLALTLLDQALAQVCAAQRWCWRIPDTVIMSLSAGHWKAATCPMRSRSRAMSWSGPNRRSTASRRRMLRDRSQSAFATTARPAGGAGSGAPEPTCFRSLAWREGSKGPMRSRFWAARVQTAWHWQEGELPGKEVWLLIEWPRQEPEPIRYCLCDLPADLSLRSLVRLARGRWRIELDYQQMKEELGLDHFEGRSWTGWHHHVTLVMPAHLFLCLEQKRRSSKRTMDPARDTA